MKSKIRLVNPFKKDSGYSIGGGLEPWTKSTSATDDLFKTMLVTRASEVGTRAWTAEIKPQLETLKAQTEKQAEETKPLSALQKLALYIPGPIVSVFSSIKNATPQDAIGIATVISLGLLILYYIFGQKNVSVKVRIQTIIIGIISFVLYVYSNGDYFFNITIPEDYKWIITVISIVYLFIISMVDFEPVNEQ